MRKLMEVLKTGDRRLRWESYDKGEVILTRSLDERVTAVTPVEAQVTDEWNGYRWVLQTADIETVRPVLTWWGVFTRWFTGRDPRYPKPAPLPVARAIPGP